MHVDVHIVSVQYVELKMILSILQVLLSTNQVTKPYRLTSLLGFCNTGVQLSRAVNDIDNVTDKGGT